MATLRAVFELTDNVSNKLRDIHGKALAVDRQFELTENRLRSFQGEMNDTSRNAAKNMTEMKESVSLGTKMMNADIASVKTELRSLTKSKWTVNIDADTGMAQAKIQGLKHELRTIRHNRMGVGPGVGGGGGGALNRLPGLGGGGPGGGRRSDGSLSVNVGPLTLSGSKIVSALVTVGPVVTSLAAGLVGVLVPAISATAAAATSAAVAVGSLGLGLGAMAAPMVIAIGRIQKTQQSLASAKKALDKSNTSLDFAKRKLDGTAESYQKNKSGAQAHTRALTAYNHALDQHNKKLNEYNQLLNKVPAGQRAVIQNLNALKEAWQKQVMQGESGKRSFMVMNSGLKIATGLMPFVARQMDRFTAAGVKLFRLIEGDTPRAQRLLTATFEPLPGYFEKMGTGVYHLIIGLTGIIRGAKPLTDYLTNAFADISAKFDAWANSRRGQNQISGFFRDMIPIVKDLFGLIGRIGDAWLKITMDPRTRNQTRHFIDLLGDFVDALPGFVAKMTDAAAKLGPPIRRFGKTIEKMSSDLAPLINNLVDKVFGPLTKGFLALPDPVRKTAEAFFLLQGLPIIGSGITSMAVAVGKLTAGLLGKIGLIDKLSASIRGLAASDIMLSAAQGGGGIGGIFGRRGARGAIGRVVGMENKAGMISRGQAIEGAGIATMTAGQKARAFGGGITGYGGVLGRGGAAAGAGMLGADTAGMLGGGALGAAGGIGLVGIGAALAGIGIAAGAMWAAWKTNFGHVKEYTAQVWAGIKDNFKEMGKTWNQILGEFGLKNKDIVDAASKTWGGLKKAIEGVGAVLIRVLGGAFSILGDIAEGVFKGILGTIQILKGGIKIVVGLITGDWTMAFEGLGKVIQGFGTIVSGTIGMVKGIMNDVSNALGLGNIFGTHDNANAGTAVAGTGAFAQGGAFGPGVIPGGQAAFPGTPPTQQPGTVMNPNLPPGGDGPGVGPKVTDAITAGRQKAAMAMGGIGGGSLGYAVSYGMGKIWSGAEAQWGGAGGGGFGTGGGKSSKGLLPNVAAAAKMFSSMFPGLVMSSGFRPGAITEFGRASLHSLGRAIDMAGPAGQMRALWNYMLGKPGVQELIYAGQASYKGGPVVPYTGSDKHYDHVHVGFGDGPGIKNKGGSNTGGLNVTLSFDGANIHINNGQDVEAFAAQLADEITSHLANMPHEDGRGVSA